MRLTIEFLRVQRRGMDDVPPTSDALLARYDVAGPRYTSYPTAPMWSESFGPADYAEKLDEPAAPVEAKTTRAAISVFSSAVLSRDVPVLRLQRGRDQGPEEDRALPPRARSGEMELAVRPAQRAAHGDPASLGRGNSHHARRGSDRAAVGRDHRALHHRPRRRGGHRDRSGGDLTRPAHAAAAPRLQPAVHGRAGLHAGGAAGHRAGADVERDGRRRSSMARGARVSRHQLRSHLRPAAADRGELAAGRSRVVGLGPDRMAVYSFAYLPEPAPHQRKTERRWPCPRGRRSSSCSCVWPTSGSPGPATGRSAWTTSPV